MSLFRRTVFFVAAALALMSGLAGGSLAVAAGPVDPLAWEQAAARPAFREVIKGDEFQKRLEASVLPTFVADLAKVTASPSGCDILEVFPGGSAEDRGLKVGDTIVSIQGRNLWNVNLRDDINRSMVIVDAKGRKRTVAVPAGGMGVKFQFHWRPELLYMRSKSRSVKWDRLVLAGIFARGDAPDFAETAWHHAIAAGYRPDYLSDQCGMEIAHAQGRGEEALQFASFCLKADAKKNELVNPASILQVAMANFKLREALKLMEEEPWSYQYNIDATRLLMIRHAEQNEARRTKPAPSERYDSLKKVNLIPKMGSKNEYTKKIDFPNWAQKRPIVIKAESSHYLPLVFGTKEAVRDMELRVKFRFRPHDEAQSKFSKIVQVGLMDMRTDVDRNVPPFHTQAALMADVNQNGYCSVLAANLRLKHEWQDPLIRGDGKTEHEIRLLRFDGRGEVFYDGKRVLYLPVREEIDRLDVMLKVVGTYMEITDLKVTGLSE